MRISWRVSFRDEEKKHNYFISLLCVYLLQRWRQLFLSQFAVLDVASWSRECQCPRGPTASLVASQDRPAHIAASAPKPSASSNYRRCDSSNSGSTNDNTRVPPPRSLFNMRKVQQGYEPKVQQRCHRLSKTCAYDCTAALDSARFFASGKDTASKSSCTRFSIPWSSPAPQHRSS